MNIPNGDFSNASSDNTSFFSSSLPLLPQQNRMYFYLTHKPPSSFKLLCSNHLSLLAVNPLDQIASGLNHFNDDQDSHPMDEEQLLAGLMDEINLTSLPNTLDDLEEYDLFGSGGGLELESDLPRMSFADSKTANGIFQNIAGEHPYGEHPSRTLFVRNINSTVDDSELRAIFEVTSPLFFVTITISLMIGSWQQYGDIRTLYTACKHRGFVMVSYYDIRASRAAMRALQSKLLKGRKLDIHFSIPKVFNILSLPKV